MKLKFRKSLSLFMAMVLAVALVSALPAAAGGEVQPFQVTENPIGADYLLNETAVPLSATFEYNAPRWGGPDYGQVYPTEPITVRWYWSYEDSNTGRDNGAAPLTVAYAREIKNTTTYVPATDEVGVKYYYAVISYHESVMVETGVWDNIPREAVTNPARIEVIAPKNEQDFTVSKTDENGVPLAGATIRLEGLTDEEIPRVYDVITNSAGKASFTVEYGQYVLTENAAPTGYTATDDKYIVSATPNGLSIFNEEDPNQLIEDVVFVNTKIPELLTHHFTVRKTDGDGVPLLGATIRVEGTSEAGNLVVFDVVTNNDGVAMFTIENGEYVLSEYNAPAGYNATDDTYIVKATPDGLFIFNSQQPNQPVNSVVFVNKEIPPLNKDDHFAYMQGYPDGTFKPGNNMTRAEAVVMFSRLLDETMDLTTDYRGAYYPDVLHTNPWAGVNTQPWYANQVCYMHWKGVLASYSRDGMFRPNEPVTRAEFATLASHFEKLELTDVNIFTDVPDNHWAVKFINSAAAKGWIIGYSDGTFAPDANITRAEVVTLVNRILERKADEGYLAVNVATLPRNYSDVRTHWAYLAIMEASMGHDYDIGSAGDEIWTTMYP
ncbi:MAG: S-layer homology domain-containing protein [Oscillospiraceae bacterium]|nr:S-layer homology domain-containing protein [Oscillospiraceae bacterium]